jgi:hypothetical protein
MESATIALAFPYVYWILLVALGLGAFAFVAVTAYVSDATRGYLGFTAACAVVLVGLGLLADLALPDPPRFTPTLVIRPAGAPVDLVRRLALAGFAVLGMIYVVGVGRRVDRGRLAALGLAALASGASALMAAAFGWAPDVDHGVPLAVQMVLLTLASGGALAALVLGHWYLVTPKVSERPLLLQTRLLTGVIGLQLGVFAAWALFGGGPGQQAFEVLTGDAALFGWLRLVVTLVFPLTLVAMARATARTRSMESATGLLYIALAAILAGTIGAATLFLAAGLLL